MNSQKIAQQIELVMLKYKRGLIPLSQAREELAFCMALLKAQEQAVLEERMDRIEAVLEDRKEQPRWQ